MKKILFVLSFLFTTFMVNAQVLSVSGVVTDSITGATVPGVQIVISNPSFGGSVPVGWVTTDANGSYSWLDSIGAFPVMGIGILDVSMIDCNGAQVNQTITYTPNQISLTANFMFCAGGSGGGSGNCALSLSPIIFNGNVISMSATLNGGIGAASYFWDMGDGASYTTQSVNHTYQAGTYTLCVIALDNAGCVDSLCIIITLTGSGGGNCGVAMSYYPDTSNHLTQYFHAAAIGGSAPYTYAWDFGDGNTATSASPTHTYAMDSIYHVCVTVTDANGCTTTDCQLVLAIGNTPQCYASLSYIPDNANPLIHYFSVSASGGSAPYTYAWDFGDGNTSISASPTHTYTQAGTYLVCVDVTDANGCVATDCFLIYVFGNSNPCVTSFTSSSTVMNPNSYVFTSVNANNANTLYLWDFGDGTVDTLSGSIATHTYTQAGIYFACLAEFDFITGCVATYCDTVIVAGGAPCQAFITYSNMPGSLVVDFFGSATPNAVSYAWDFGDGNTSTAQNPTHTYQTIATGPVSYNVTLTTTDASGCTAIGTETVFVFGGNGMGQIMGYLWKDTLNFTPADGLVYLIEYDSITGTLTAIDTVATQQGFFDFQNVPMGLYLVKAALLPTDPDYANYLPTYFIQSLNWANGQYVGPAPFGLPAFIDIQLVAGNNPGGAGFIGGLVVNGAGRPVVGNVTTIEDMTTAIPMEGVSVLLLDANNNAVTHTVTGADGSYSFNNITMGTYNVHVEEVGKITFPANIVVDADNSNHTDVHFTVHDNMVTLTATYAVTNVEDFQVFPNPVRNTANVQLELTESMNLTMTVTNLMGQEFMNQSLNLNAGDNSFPIEMIDLPTGLYLLSLKSETDVITYKIQKL